MSAAIGALTSLDFLGLGVPPDTPSLGELLSQGKNNLDAWWISLSTFGVLVVTLLLLILIGDALRDALDPAQGPRKAQISRMKRCETRASEAAHDPCSTSELARASAARPWWTASTFASTPGEKLALVGESGSGKTVTALSLLRLVENAELSGEQSCSTGRRRAARPAARSASCAACAARDIAMIFQEPMTALNPLFTVGDQIAESLSCTRASRRDAAREARGRSAAPRRHRRARAPRAQLSAPALGRPAAARDDRDGARLQPEAADRRRADHRARRHHPPADPRSARPTAREVRHGLLLITHDLNLVRRFADRVAVMESGVHRRAGRPRDVFDAPAASLHAEADRQPAGARGAAAGARRRSAVPVSRRVRCTWTTRRRCPASRAGSSSGEFVAVQRRRLRPGAGRDARRDRRIGLGQDHARAGGAGPRCRTPATSRMAGEPWSGGAANRALRREIQVVFQDPLSSLSPRLTIEADRRRGSRDARARADAAARRAQRVLAALLDVGLTRSAVSAALLAALSARILRRPAPAHRDRAGADRRAAACWCSTSRPARST